MLPPDHGDEGILDVGYDYDLHRLPGFRRSRCATDRDATMWRYRPLLPVAPDAAVPPLTVGGTPTYDAPRLAEAALGIGRVLGEGRRPPTHRLAQGPGQCHGRRQGPGTGAEVITTASTGNAAAALSGLSASVGQKNVIFVPASAPQAKIAQLLAYGSTVASGGWHLRRRLRAVHAGRRRVRLVQPEHRHQPLHDRGQEDRRPRDPRATRLAGPRCHVRQRRRRLHHRRRPQGLQRSLALGWIDRMPRIYGVQAAGSDYLAQAFESGEDVLTKPPIAADTVADSISADLPRDRIKAMAAVIETDGAYLRVERRRRSWRPSRCWPAGPGCSPNRPERPPMPA